VEGLPEIFAEGAATGTPANRMISLVAALSGHRIATVESPAVVTIMLCCGGCIALNYRLCYNPIKICKERANL